MARFTALASDDSSSDEETPQVVSAQAVKKSPQPASSEPEVDHDSDEDEEAEVEEESSSSDSESSEMDPDELLSSPPRRAARRTGRNALVEDENGEIQFAHEADREGSPASQSSGSRSPAAEQTRERYRGNPTVIPWAQRVGVDAQKMHVMQTALFRMPEEAAALKEMNDTNRVSASRIKLDLAGKVSGVGRKHSRESDHDAMRNDSRERASFAHDIEPALYRPSRKYARVEITSSIANGQEGSYFDAGLALGRSFRVSWGPGGKLVHLGSICGPLQKPTTTANSSVITITLTLSSLRPPDLEVNNRSATPSELAGKLLQHHLSHTTINRDESGVPYALPTSISSPPPPLSHTLSAAPASLADPLNFASFASLFPSLETTSPAPIFRLGRVLFDSLNLNLSSSRSTASSITPNIKERVLVLRRKAALGKWLEEVVRLIVEGDLRVEVNGSNAAYTPADAAFTHLTGHQISEACTAAANGGYPKLSTLISQAGGDDLFKDDIIGQIEIWKSEKLAPGSNTFGSKDSGLVNRGVWKIYHLLAGLITYDENEGRSADNIWVGLDWKRVFGLCLWYGTSLDQSVADAVDAYERLIKQSTSDVSSVPKLNQVARPLPRWTQTTSATAASSLALVPARSYLFSGSSDASSSQPEDPLYALIKLYADPALSLSNALNPRSFAPTVMDWGIGMCWHLYIVLSRVMRVRDFADRQEGVKMPKPTQSRPRASVARGNDDDDDEVERVEGHSPTADLLASSYAFELESWGMIQEAAFVLLHLEGSVGREKAIKDLLARSAARLDDWISSGLVGSLKLPATWIDEAKAMYQLDCGNVYAAYELYLTAQLYNSAHNIALYDLAPDAIIRKDLELLRSLFAPFDLDGRRDKIESWFVRGKIYLDYVNIMTRLPKLLDEVAAEQEDRETVLDATQADEIEDLSKRIPKILALLPDILHRDRAVDDRHVAALEEMSKDLLKLLERSKPLLLSQIQQPTLNMLDGAAKINLVKGVGLARFLHAIEA
ncbi:nuclear protein 96-domain-containing protein [Panaeolus papilionaceus]|nr:nuclear protein 96-domain-containing protein [Panaeolus papilionaceus]